MWLVKFVTGFEDDDDSGDDKHLIDTNELESLTSAESSTNNTITIPWLGPINLPWNLTTLSQEVKKFEKSPVRVLLKVSNSTTIFSSTKKSKRFQNIIFFVLKRSDSLEDGLQVLKLTAGREYGEEISD